MFIIILKHVTKADEIKAVYIQHDIL